MDISLENLKLKMFRAILYIAVTIASASLYARDYYVKPKGSGAHTGDNWANAMDNRSFAEKLLVAVPEDVFHLAAGVYVPYFDMYGNDPDRKKTKTFLIRDGVSVHGGYDAHGKRISDKDKAMSSARLSGVLESGNYNNNVYHVVTIANNANNATTPMLQRLSISRGNADGGGNNSNGAGIFVGKNAGGIKVLQFSYISVHNNKSNGEGNGIYISQDANVSIDNSEITHNTRISNYDVWGGGISVIRSRLAISNSKLTGNVANHGGAIHILAGHLSSHLCEYDGNSAKVHGGAIDAYDRSSVVFKSDTFTGNHSDEGGAVHNESGSDIHLKRCVFIDNTAKDGGGFYNSGDCSANIDSCLFERNTAKQRGGGIDNRGRMQINQSRIIGNTANTGEGNGGGVNQRGRFFMTQCEVSYNQAKDGGGIYTENNFAQIANTTISNNTASIGGGGVCHKYDKCELHFVTITGNVAPKGRGSGFLANSRPTINNSIISGNYDDDDFNGVHLFETGEGLSEDNIFGSDYYPIGSRRGEGVMFEHGKHLGPLDFNRGAFTRTHALTWTGLSRNNPAVGRGDFDDKYEFDQTGAARNKLYPSLGAYEEAFFKAQNDRMIVDKQYDILNILANDSYPAGCNPKVTLLVTSSKLAQSITYNDNYNVLTYVRKAGIKTGIDTIPYRIQCADGTKDSAFVIVEIGKQYDHPQNIKDEVACMNDMPAVNFYARLKVYNDEVQLDGFSMPLVGDLNGDGKPEIIGLGAVKDDGRQISWLEAVGKSIVIYDGQTGDVLLNFNLSSLGLSGFNDRTGYGTKHGFKLRWEPRHNTYSHLAIADLDNDGIGEIVVTETGSGKVYALKPRLNMHRQIISLDMFWEAKVPHKAPIDVGYYDGDDACRFGSPTPYISDLNGDGIADVIVYNKIYNGRTGELELELETLNRFDDPSSDVNRYNRYKQYAYVGRLPSASECDDIVPVIAINDIDNDGNMEIIAGSKIYKIHITDPNYAANNSYSVIHGPESLMVGNTNYYLTDGFTVVADIDGDDVPDVIVVKRHLNREHFIIYVWDPTKTGNHSLKAYQAIEQSAGTGFFSVPFVGDINGRIDGIDLNGKNQKSLPEICLTMGRLRNGPKYNVTNSLFSNIPNYMDGMYNYDDGSGQPFQGHVVAFTYAAYEPDISKRLKLSWMMKHSDGSHQTGIVMFDFDADGINDLVYRDELALRVISPANTANGYDFVDLSMDESSHPDVIRFRETGITSYTGFECPVIADVNGDGSADIVTFATKVPPNKRLTNSAGYLFVYEADGESWAPSRPVWNQGIYYPLQINDNLTVPKRPQSTLTKYRSQLPGKPEKIIQPFNGNWIQQPIVRTNNYVPILMTADPSIRLEDMKIIYSTAAETKISLKIENRGQASVNSQTPIAFYKQSIEPKNRIRYDRIKRDIYPGEHATIEYRLSGNHVGEIIYVRLVEMYNVFPAKGYIDCDLSNNVAYSMMVNAVEDHFSIASNDLTYLDVTANDMYHKHITPQIEILEAPRHGRALVTSDSRISYISDYGFQGVDTIRYRIRCTDNKITVSDEAAVYILNMRPGAREYVACPGATMLLELDPIPNVTYDWYKTETKGRPVAGGNSITFTKSRNAETLWVETVVKGFSQGKFPRFKIDLRIAEMCNSDKLTECMIDGTLLFKEDFGGNQASDDEIVQNASLPQVKQYTYSTAYIDNSYTIRKVSGGSKDWLNIGDHTNPNNKKEGYMLQFKATKSPGQFYECQLDDLCEGMTLNISAWLASIYRSSPSNARLIFVVEDLDGNTLSKYYTGNLTNGMAVWKNFGYSFTVPRNVSSVVLRIINNGDGTPCFVLDDVSIYLCVPKVTLTDDGVHELCIGDEHEFHGKLLDVNNTAPFGDSPAYRLEFRKNKTMAWKAVKTGKQKGATDIVLTTVVTEAGYYRFVVGHENFIDCANCVAASDEIPFRVKDCSSKAVSDSALVAYNDSVRFDALANDKYLCNRNALAVFDTVANSGLHLGRLVKNADMTFTYIANKDVSGIDSVDYQVACPGTKTAQARIYFFVNKLVPQHYACDGKTVEIGFPTLPDASYIWYDNSSGGNIIGGVANSSLSVVKGSADDKGVWWIQPEWKGIVFPRFALVLKPADNCGETLPSGCLAEGTVLSREDFGNSPGGVGSFNKGAGEQIYSKRIDAVCEETELLFSSWILGTPNTPFNLTFTLEDARQNVHARYCTGEVSSSDAKWRNYGFKFGIPKGYSSFVLKIANNSVGSFSMDSIEIRLCTPKIRIDDIVGDTLVCLNKPFVIKGSYPDAGNPFGNEIVYRWEFRHTDSLRWKILAEHDAPVPLNAELSFADVAKNNDGYYRLRVGKRGNIDAMNCCALSDSVSLKIVESYRFPDIRIQLSPLPKRVVNLTSFIDSIHHTKTIRWERTAAYIPAIINGTEETTGSVNSGDFPGMGTYTYKYTAASQCGSSESKVYIRTLKDKLPNTPDTVMVCGRYESSKALNLNHILGLELGGTWEYGATVNPDATVADNVVKMSPPSRYAGALVFNAVKAWKSAPASYSHNYRGHQDAKIFNFIYVPSTNASVSTKKKLVIVVVN